MKGDTVRILVVDDDFTALSLIEAALSVYGFTDVTTASSAVAAMQIIREEPRPFDCFLLDYHMPDIDGTQLCAQIRLLRPYRSTPIIFVTALSDRSSINAAYSVGAVDYISKPIDPQEIAIRVSIAEKLALEAGQNSKPARGLAAKPANRKEKFPRFELEDPVPIFNVTGVISRMALDNYIHLIAQTDPSEFAVSAIAINEFEDIHESLSPAMAYAVVSEFAKTISESLKRSESLICYNGYGEFICVTKNTDLSENRGHARRINSRIARMNLVSEDEMPIIATVSIGKSVHPTEGEEVDPSTLIKEALTYADTPEHVFRSRAKAGASLASCTSPILNL